MDAILEATNRMPNEGQLYGDNTMRDLNINEIKSVNGGVIPWLLSNLAWEGLKIALASGRPLSPSRYTGGFHG